MNARLTLFILALVPVLIAVAGVFGSRLQKASTQIQDQLADSTVVAEEASTAVPTADHQRRGWSAWGVVAVVLAAVVVTWIATTWISPRETVSRLIHDLMDQQLLISEGKTIYLRKSALASKQETKKIDMLLQS